MKTPATEPAPSASAPDGGDITLRIEGITAARKWVYANRSHVLAEGYRNASMPAVVEEMLCFAIGEYLQATRPAPAAGEWQTQIEKILNEKRWLLDFPTEQLAKELGVVMSEQRCIFCNAPWPHHMEGCSTYGDQPAASSPSPGEGPAPQPNESFEYHRVQGKCGKCGNEISFPVMGPAPQGMRDAMRPMLALANTTILSLLMLRPRNPDYEIRGDLWDGAERAQKQIAAALSAPVRDAREENK